MAALATLLLLVPIGVAAEEETSAVIIRGRVQEALGTPVAGLTVTLIRTKKTVDLRRLQWEESEAVLERASTDAQGFYEIRAADDGSFSSYFLRFNDPKTFDRVHFVAPDDEDITRRFHRGRPLVENRLLREHRDWKKVQEEMARVGEGSPRGVILRQMGLPERVESRAPGGPAREEWWYYRRGIVYQFEGERIAGERRFDPVPAPPALAEAAP